LQSIVSTCEISRLPLGVSFKAKSMCDAIIEKIRVSFGRMEYDVFVKGTLIETTLSNFPIYFMSLFPLSIGIVNRIKKLR
jgi:hypothetical protein